MERIPAFVDTSGIYAALVTTDRNHSRAVAALERLEREDRDLVSTSYVLQESVALLQSRQGVRAVRAFHESFCPLLRVVWVDEALHERGMAALLGSGARGVSLTDRVSFEVMRRDGVREAFAFDEDFESEGFSLLS